MQKIIASPSDPLEHEALIPETLPNRGIFGEVTQSSVAPDDSYPRFRPWSTIMADSKEGCREEGRLSRDLASRRLLQSTAPGLKVDRWF